MGRNVIHLKQGVVIGISNPRRLPIIQRLPKDKIWRIWTDYHPTKEAGTVLMLMPDGTIEEWVIAEGGEVDFTRVIKGPDK